MARLEAAPFVVYKLNPGFGQGVGITSATVRPSTASSLKCILTASWCEARWFARQDRSFSSV